MTHRTTINTMKVEPPAGKRHGVFLCMNKRYDNKP
jgi:hypothetical protein